jgi:hypothetical protein
MVQHTYKYEPRVKLGKRYTSRNYESINLDVVYKQGMVNI